MGAEAMRAGRDCPRPRLRVVSCLFDGLTVTGTIGILRAAVRDKEFSLADANGLLARMIDAGFHAPVDRIT